MPQFDGLIVADVRSPIPDHELAVGAAQRQELAVLGHGQRGHVETMQVGRRVGLHRPVAFGEREEVPEPDLAVGARREDAADLVVDFQGLDVAPLDGVRPHRPGLGVVNAELRSRPRTDEIAAVMHEGELPVQSLHLGLRASE